MLVIIPGWRHAASDWQAVSFTLNRHGIQHKILDIPGFGTIPTNPTIKTLDDLSLWCKAQITNLQSESNRPLILCGHSCGGRVALKLVAEGLAVDQLILCGSPNLYRPTLRVKVITVFAMLARPIRSLVPYSIRRKFRSDDYENAKNSPLQDLYLDVVQDDQTHVLELVQCPVALIWGENDEAAPVWIAHELLERLKQATLTIIPLGGHNLHHDKPQLLAAKIAKYAS